VAEEAVSAVEAEAEAKPVLAQHSRRAKLPTMRKPNTRATQGETSGGRTVSRSESPEESPHSRSKRFLGSLKGAAEFVAAALAIVVGVHDAIQEPQNHAQTPQPSAPFSLYFSLHNPSLVLPMSDVKIECFLKHARADHGVIETSFRSVTANIQRISIPPGETIQSNCPLDDIVTRAGFGNIQIAQVQLVSTFKTLGIERNTSSEMFNWNAISRKWTEGEIIN
jgi:hypothetical protein